MIAVGRKVIVVDILLFYSTFRVRLKAGFFVREAVPSYIIHGKIGSFLKPRGDVQEDDLKAGKLPNLVDWGKESSENEGVLHTQVDGKMLYGKVPTMLGNYYHFFDGLYDSIVRNHEEPVTAEEGVKVMRIIEAAIQSSIEKKVISL